MSDEQPSCRRDAFVTTHWSVVLAASEKDRSSARAALAQLCQTYWMPLYMYVRRRGFSPEDAQDLTQEFFARFLARDPLAGVERQKGKFRSFLLASMNNFLADEWDKARARKRGGGQVLTLDIHSAEARLAEQTVDPLSPEKVFEQRWALALLEEVYQRLRQEFEQEGKGEWFQALRFALMGERSALAYAEIARQLATSESAVKVAVHRLRQRYRAVLRETLAATLADPAEVEEELRYLFRTLSSDARP